MKKRIALFVVLCAMLFAAMIPASADSVVMPDPWSVLFEDENKAIFITPTKGEFGERNKDQPKSGLYYNEDPPRNIYYFDDYLHMYDWYLHESNFVFSDDGVYAYE